MLTLPSIYGALALLHEGEFSWTHFSVHPSVLIGCIVFAGLYLWGIRRAGGRIGGATPPGTANGSTRAGPAVAADDEAIHDREPLTIDELTTAPSPTERVVSVRRVVSFMAGVVLLFLALDGPLHDLSDDYLFSAHMIQHMVLMMAVPPLWLLGLPPWLLDGVLRRRTVRAIARFLTAPLIAYGIYNVIFAGWHLPTLYNTALEHHPLHIVQHLMFIGAAVLMWWPVVNPVPELVRMQTPTRILYLFALGIPMSFVSAMITFSEKILYPFYAAAPRIFGLSAMDDQQLGGVIMWVPGMIVFWTAITVIFFRWATRENREEWRERELLTAQH